MILWSPLFFLPNKIESPKGCPLTFFPDLMSIFMSTYIPRQFVVITIVNSTNVIFSNNTSNKTNMNYKLIMKDKVIKQIVLIKV